jgi:hypothetical protein
VLPVAFRDDIDLVVDDFERRLAHLEHAFMTRCAFSASSSISSWGNAFGTMCHERQICL